MRWMVFGIAALVSVARADDVLPPGSTLDATTVGSVESLLAPEVAAHYRDGAYRNLVASWPKTPPWEPAFGAASAANAARLDVDARGTIVEKASGKPARGLYGLPFAIDASDPKASTKVVWNAYYALWRIASTHDVLGLEWVGNKGLERQADLESHVLYWEGVPPSRAPKENPQDLASQSLAFVTSPADLHGTTSLAWRFRGADAQDQSWTYVPALRRVRQVSPTNRSDGFLGSDLSQDDGAFFDGKPEWFGWKLIGEREVFALADPASLSGNLIRTQRPGGGIAETWPADRKVLGHQDPAWTGSPWAPIGAAVVKRKVWVIEATPSDPYYLFARIELGIDQETFQGVFSRKFDAQGSLLRSLQFLSYASQPITVDGESLVLPGASMGAVLAENTKQNRATVVGVGVAGTSVHERRLPIDPGTFALEKLGVGK